MSKIYSLIDTCIYRPIWIQRSTREQIVSQEFYDFLNNLEIDVEIIHNSVYDELGNQLKSRLGAVRARTLLRIMQNDASFEFPDSNSEERNLATEIMGLFPNNRPATDVNGRVNYRGIGIADAKLIVFAQRFVATRDFDKFHILTFDQDLRIALQNPQIGLSQYVVTNIPPAIPEPQVIRSDVPLR